MKKTIFLISILFSFSSYYAIGQIPQANSTIYNSSLNKFVGTWVYINNNDTITIMLKKETILLPVSQNVHEEVIVGYHCYTKGGVIIESSLQHSNANFSEKKSTILASNRAGIDDGSFLDGTLKDISKSKLVKIHMVINNINNQLIITIKNREGLKIGTYDWSFTLPSQFAVYKIQ